MKNLEQLCEETALSVPVLEQRIAAGHIVLVGNPLHLKVPLAVGEGCPTRVNANIGATPPYPENLMELELQKLETATAAGADAVMDLSLGHLQRDLLRHLLGKSTLPLGTVPLYGMIGSSGASLSDLTEQSILQVIEEQAALGVDFMTLHCGINRESFQMWKKSRRLLPVVSRGGSMVCRYMEETGKDNPFYRAYGEILEVCRRYGVTISLGDGFRPGCAEDAGDCAQTAELLVLGDLTERALEAGAKVIVEGPGHMRLGEIAENVRTMKRLCHGVPYYVLGPLPVDSAPGYDHITAAIGGAQASAAGADFLCYVTPAEHLCLPEIEDVRLGVIASRIAARCGDVEKNIGGSRVRERNMSASRGSFDWEGQFLHSIDPIESRKRAHIVEGRQGCSMCGELCAMKPII